MKEVLGVTEGFKQVPDVLIHMLEGQSDWVVVSIFEEELEAKGIQVSFKNSLIAEIYVRSTRWVCHQSLWQFEMGLSIGRVVYPGQSERDLGLPPPRSSDPLLIICRMGGNRPKGYCS